jgi:hypothetical protein
MSEVFIISFFAGMVLFLFPVFVYTDAYLDLKENKAWFSLSLFKHLKIFGGYAQLEQDGIVLHLSKKKAVFVFYNQMSSTRKKFEITDGFQLYRFHQIVETGGSQSPTGVMIASLLQSFGGAVCAVLKTKHPFLSLKNGTLLANEPCLKVSLQTVFIFNNLVLTIAIVKKILEVIINWIRKKRLTAYLRKQRNN